MNKQDLRIAIGLKNLDLLKVHKELLKLEEEINKSLSLRDLKESLSITNCEIRGYKESINEARKCLKRQEVKG